jgi:hypothetical protein
VQLEFHPAYAAVNSEPAALPHLLAERLSTVRHRVDFGFRARESRRVPVGLFFS